MNFKDSNFIESETCSCKIIRCEAQISIVLIAARHLQFQKFAERHLQFQKFAERQIQEMVRICKIVILHNQCLYIEYYLSSLYVLNPTVNHKQKRERMRKVVDVFFKPRRRKKNKYRLLSGTYMRFTKNQLITHKNMSSLIFHHFVCV